MILRLEVVSNLIRHSDYYLIQQDVDNTCGGKHIDSIKFEDNKLCNRYYQRILTLPVWKPHYKVSDYDQYNWLDFY
jgi:hypothetical protein